MGRTELGAGSARQVPRACFGEMLLGLPLISAIARPRQVRKLPRCESGGGKVLCPYYSCRCRRATTAMPEISEFRFAGDLYGAFSVKRLFWVCCQFFVRSGKAVLRPVACDQVRGGTMNREMGLFEALASDGAY